MGLFRDVGREWTQCAYALGMPLHPLTAPIEPVTDTVAAIHKRLGPPGQGGHPDTWWMYGKRREIEFVVGGRTEVERDSEGGTRTRHFTHCIAEIDPPLWIGLRALLDKGGLISQLFQTNAPQYAAWDPHRLQQLFAYRANDGYDPHEVLATAYESGLRAEVDDTSVRFTASAHVTDAPSIGSAIDGATLIAARLRAARARLGPAQWEIDAALAWGLCAGRHGLAFDKERFRASGLIEGSRADLRLLGGANPMTRFRLRYPQPLACTVRVTVGPPPSWLGQLLGVQDIELGDPAFDPLFVVKGQPEPAVRQLLGAHARAALVALASRGADVVLEQTRMDVRLRGMLFRVDDLDTLTAQSLAVIRGFWR
jgi:hypothetical protein